MLMKPIFKHTCQIRKEFEVLLSAYPHIIYRCHICLSPMKSIPLDDLSNDDLNMALEMIQRYREEGS